MVTCSATIATVLIAIIHHYATIAIVLSTMLTRSAARHTVLRNLEHE